MYPLFLTDFLTYNGHNILIFVYNFYNYQNWIYLPVEKKPNWQWFKYKTCYSVIWKKYLLLVAQVCLILWDPMDCSLPGFSVHGDSPGKNTGVGCHSLIQGIFQTQGSNPGLPHCRQILYHLSHQETSMEASNPRMIASSMNSSVPYLLWFFIPVSIE